MGEHDSNLSKTPDKIKKLPRHLKYFHDEKFRPIYKRDLLSLFKIKIKKKKRKLGKNFIEINQYEKAIYKYNRNETYQEIKDLEVNTMNWYDKLTSVTQRFINAVDNILFNRAYKRLKDTGFDKYETNYERILKFAQENNRDDLLTPDKKSLRDEVLINNVALNEELPFDYYDKYYRLLDYAYKYDKSLLNDSGTDLALEAITKFLFLDENIPTPNIKKIHDSTKRTYDTVTDYALCNIDKFELFVTLTFALKENEKEYEKNNEQRESGEHDLKFILVDDPTDYDDCNTKKVNFLNNLRKRLKKDDLDLYYLGVPEYQQNGNIHYHFLMSHVPHKYLYDVPKWLDFDYKIMDYRNAKGFKHWKYGKSEVEKIRDGNKISNYIGKYLLENVYNLNETEYLERLHKQRFYASRNLTKPVEEINKDYNDDYDDIYLTEYKNVYNDSNISRILFTLNDNERN